MPLRPQRRAEMADPSHYPWRQIVQTDEEWWGQGTPKLAFQLTPEEPWLTLDIEGKTVEFLVNTIATYSVLNTRSGKLSHKSYKTMRVSGKAQEWAFVEPLEC